MRKREELIRNLRNSGVPLTDHQSTVLEIADHQMKGALTYQMASEPLLKGQEVAKFISVSYPTLLRWITEGHGPPHYVLNEPKLSRGNTKKKNGEPRQPRHLIRFRMSEVEEWVKTRRRDVNGSPSG